MVFRRLFGLGESSKVFCIGRNKTGTTSLGKVLEDLGYRLGDQATMSFSACVARQKFHCLIVWMR